MENSQADGSSRPAFGFPIGTALLLIFIFSIGGFFSCCYHRSKLRSPRRSFSHNYNHHEEEDTDLEANGTNNHNPVIQSPSSKPSQIYSHGNQNTNGSIPVIMPGDNIAKFIALPCPCKPFRPKNICAINTTAVAVASAETSVQLQLRI
ncbi:hypothetical protein MKX03_019614 [Papaver bracteatum]|nr:hypothetical protein MKX03_019614 [Papaver bracteatum]